MNMKLLVFCEVFPCILQVLTDVSEKLTAYFIRAVIIWNVGQYLATSQKIAILKL